MPLALCSLSVRNDDNKMARCREPIPATLQGDESWINDLDYEEDCEDCYTV